MFALNVLYFTYQESPRYVQCNLTLQKINTKFHIQLFSTLLPLEEKILSAMFVFKIFEALL